MKDTTESDPDDFGSIGEFPELVDVLISDILPLAKKAPNDLSSLDQAKRRTLVRSVFAFIEATAHRLKQLAMEADDASTFTTAERALCAEEFYGLDETGKPKVRRARLRFLPNLRFAFYIAAKGERVDFALNVSADGWQAVRNSIPVRDRLMHPKHSSQLNVTDDEVKEVFKAFRWISHELHRWMGLVGNRLESEVLGGRLRRWGSASYKTLAPLNGLMIQITRGLAEIDIELIRLDLEAEILDAESLEPFSTRRITLSHLWVLGSYELIRTIEELIRKPQSGRSSIVLSVTEQMHPRAREVKALFERVRVPLAKFVVAERYPDDSHFAQPGLNPERAVGWWVNDDEFIERRALSDALLQFFEEFAEALAALSPTGRNIEE